MTGYTVHTGSSEKFSQGWDEIFSSPKKKGKKAASKAAPEKKSAGKKSVAKKAAVKKKSAKSSK